MMATPKDIATQQEVTEAKAAAAAAAKAARLAAEQQARDEAIARQNAIRQKESAGVAAPKTIYASPDQLERQREAGTFQGRQVIPTSAVTSTISTSTTATSTSTTSTSTSTSSTSTSSAGGTRTVVNYKGVGANRVRVTTVFNADGSVNSTTEEPDPDTSADSSGSSNPLMQLWQDQQNLARLDAFRLLEDTFTSYGLAELVPIIRGYMTSNIGPNEATLLLKSTPAYQNRFKGNQLRVAQGMNAYSEAEYIAHEDEYGQLFKQYGVSQFATKAEFADLIGNDITKVDLNERLKLAVVNVQNADPNIKAQLKQFYPQITDADLVSYFLKPDQTLQSLQLKVSSAAVGAAAAAQGLQVSGVGTEAQRARAEQLATILGPTSPENVLAAARTGFEKVSRVLPFAQKLTSIYGAQTSGYGQTEAEQEFLLGGQKEALQREGLTALEEAQFQGRSGIDYQINPLGRSIQGTF